MEGYQRFNISNANSEEYGNLKRDINKIIRLLQTDGYDVDVIYTLRMVKLRLDNCGHCDGETDESGTCICNQT